MGGDFPKSKGEAKAVGLPIQLQFIFKLVWKFGIIKNGADRA